MQYSAPKKVRSRGLIRTRYKIALLLTGVICLYEYLRVSYLLLPKIADSNTRPELIKLLDRQSSYPLRPIWWTVKLISYVAAGRLAEICSAKWILFTSVMLIGICLCMIPFAVGQIQNAMLLDGITGVMYLSYGCILPAAHVMLSRWSPPKERLVMGSAVYCSLQMGKALAVFINTWLSSTLGWQYVFYSSAIVCIIWLIIWVLVVHDDPMEQESMSEEERKFLHESLKDEIYENKRRIESVAPWKFILTSPNIWAITLVHTTMFFASRNYYKNFTRLAARFRSNNRMHPLNQAVILTMPYVWSAVITILFGLIFFNLTQNGMSKVKAHRLGSILSLIGVLMQIPYEIFETRIPGYSMIVNSFLILTTATFMATTFLLHLDTAPNYAGTLIGFTFTIAEIPGLIFDGILGERDWTATKTYLSLIFAIVSIFMGTVYFSPDLQSWNNYNHLLEGEDFDIEY